MSVRFAERKVRWVAVGAAVLAGAFYALFLAHNISACAGNSDASGYFNHARLLASGATRIEPRAVPGLSVGGPACAALGVKPAPDGHGLVPTYPPGLALLILAGVPFAGWAHAGDAVLLVHALLGVLLTYALGRAFGLPRPWAAVGGLILAVSPLYLFMSLEALSDVPALVWTTAAVLAAWRSRAGRGWAVAAGAATAMAVLIRPSDALIVIPLAAALDPALSAWLLFLAGGLPGALFWGIHSRALYGAALATGYGDVSGLFTWGVVAPTLAHWALWLPILFTPIVVIGPAGLPRMLRVEPRKAAVLALWAFVFPAFYAAYWCSHETWWYTRFLLPAAPAFVVAGLLAAKRVGERIQGRRLRLSLSCLAAAAIVANGVFWSAKFNVVDVARDEAVYPEAAAFLREYVPPDAVLAVMQLSGAVQYYTDFAFVRWDALEPADYSRMLRAAQAARRPICAVLFPFETKAALRDHMPDRWTQVGSVRQITIWRRAAEDPDPLPPAADPASPRQLAAFAGDRVILRLDEGWFGRESTRRHTWAWARGSAKLLVGGPPRGTGALTLGFRLRSLVSRTVEVREAGVPLWRGRVGTDFVAATVPSVRLVRGRAVLEFLTDTPPKRAGAGRDARMLAFAIYDPRLAAAEKEEDR